MRYPGDVDCDGAAGSVDAALVLQHSAGLVESLECLDATDVSQDSIANSIDAALILQFEADLIQYF
jgi:hypothetical protein